MYQFDYENLNFIRTIPLTRLFTFDNIYKMALYKKGNRFFLFKPVTQTYFSANALVVDLTATSNESIQTIGISGTEEVYTTDNYIYT